jgi:hypothetical protein
MNRSAAGVALLALFFAACGGEGAPASSTEGAPEVTAQGNVPGATPEASFTALQRAFAAKDWSAIIDFMPPSSVAAQEAKHKENLSGPLGELMAARLELEPEAVNAMSFKDYTAAVFGQSMEMNPKKMNSILNSTIIDTKIEGDRATIKVNTGEKEQDASFQLEDGLWYWSSLAGRVR